MANRDVEKKVEKARPSLTGNRNESTSSKCRYVGANAFPDGLPVCQPTKPGRHPKPLKGPVHPGFPKPGSSN